MNPEHIEILTPTGPVDIDVPIRGRAELNIVTFAFGAIPTGNIVYHLKDDSGNTIAYGVVDSSEDDIAVVTRAFFKWKTSSEGGVLTLSHPNSSDDLVSITVGYTFIKS